MPEHNFPSSSRYQILLVLERLVHSLRMANIIDDDEDLEEIQDVLSSLIERGKHPAWRKHDRIVP